MALYFVITAEASNAGLSFLKALVGEHEIIIEKINIAAEEMVAFELLQFNAQAPEIEEAEEDFITALLDKFVMNVTALNNYLKCPLQFYYQN